jgi:steroid delta-isomerase
MVTREHMESMCDRYLAAVETRDADQVMALFSDDPTVEDPVDSERRVGPAAVREFYSHITGSVRLQRIGPACVVGNRAAFLFRLDIERDGQSLSYASIDVMTFGDDGRIASMVAYPDRTANPGG